MRRSTGKTLFDYFPKRRNVVGTSDSAAIVDTVSTTSAEESVSFNTGAEVASVCMSSVSSVNIHNQLQPRDPLHGKQAAFEFFKDGPFQPSLNKYPETKGRKFRSTWFAEYKWLEYSVTGDKAFCFPCRLFGSTGCHDESFISNGFRNWKKAVQRFKEHERSSSHLFASQRWQEGLKSKESVVSKIRIYPTSGRSERKL